VLRVLAIARQDRITLGGIHRTTIGGPRGGL
jgi:hypothetical protein